MGYFITDRVGLIIATLNTVTFVTLVYVFVKAVEQRTFLFRALDRVYGPLLSPLRKVLPPLKLDVAALIFAALLPVAVFYVKRRWL